MLVREIASRFKQATSDLTTGTSPMCSSQESLEWKRTCDCAMLGALHRIMKRARLPQWDVETAEKLGDTLGKCVTKLVAWLEKVRIVVIDESTMTNRQGGAHNACTPWRQLTVEDLLAKHKVEDLVPFRENVTKQQAAA